MSFFRTCYIRFKNLLSLRDSSCFFKKRYVNFQEKLYKMKDCASV